MMQGSLTTERPRGLLAPASEPPEALETASGRLYTGPSDADPLRRLGCRVTVDQIPADVAQLADEHVDDPDQGFFGPGSMMWEITPEQRNLTAGVAAILTQMTHPAVCAALEKQSTIDVEPQERLYRTLDTVRGVAYGNLSTAIRAVVHMRRQHETVEGRIGEGFEDVAADKSYDANDPGPALWVGATLYKFSLSAHEHCCRELTPSERRQFWDEFTLVLRLTGLPAAVIPADYEDAERYYERMLDEECCVTDRTRSLGHEILDGLPASGFAKAVTAGHLPPSIRDGYGFDWGRRHQLAFESTVKTLRAAPSRGLPAKVRYARSYRELGRHHSD